MSIVLNYILCLLFDKNLSEAEFLGEIQTKVLRVFLLAIHSHLYSFEISISSNSRNILQFPQFIYCTSTL
jgi:hypothetical protein